MVDFKLDATGDLELTDSGDVALTESIVQAAALVFRRMAAWTGTGLSLL